MRRGFTIIELLAASALAALLTLAGFRVIASINRSNAVMAKQESAAPDTAAVVELLRHDLLHARYIKTARNSLSLAGHGGVSPADYSPTHLPALIVYRVQRVGNHSWLVREQGSLVPGRPRAPWTELVWPGAATLDFQSLAPAETIAVAGIGIDRSPGFKAASSRARLVVRKPSGEPLLDEVIFTQ